MVMVMVMVNWDGSIKITSATARCLAMTRRVERLTSKASPLLLCYNQTKKEGCHDHR